MAPGGSRPSITIGIQPQIALYTIILGGVCAFGWYTEKYRRNETDIDGQINMIYMSDVKEAHDKLPQMTATIRGQDMRLDDRMNKMVWGGKAHFENDTFGGSAFGGAFGGGIGSKASTHDDEDYDDDNVRTTKPVKINIARQDEDDELPKKKKKRRRKKKKGKETITKEDEKRPEETQSFVIQPTVVVGVAIGAVAVAAISFLSSGVGGHSRR